MKKENVLMLFDNAQDLADTLKFAHRNTYYNWPNILTDRIVEDVKRRMQSAGLKIPKHWK
jgi:hypothetical protein